MAESSGKFGSNARKIRSIKVKEAPKKQNDIASSHKNSNATSSGPEYLETGTSSKSEEKPVSYSNGIYAFIILGANVAYCSPMTLIPWSDIYVHPSSWWENLIITGIILKFLRVTLGTLREVYLVFKMESILTLKFYFTFWLLGCIAYIIANCGFYYYWTILNGYNPPMPLAQSFISFYISMLVNWALIWFHFPKVLRKEAKFRKRLKNYIFYLIW